MLILKTLHNVHANGSSKHRYRNCFSPVDSQCHFLLIRINLYTKCVENLVFSCWKISFLMLKNLEIFPKPKKIFANRFSFEALMGVRKAVPSLVSMKRLRKGLKRPVTTHLARHSAAALCPVCFRIDWSDYFVQTTRRLFYCVCLCRFLLSPMDEFSFLFASYINRQQEAKTFLANCRWRDARWEVDGGLWKLLSCNFVTKEYPNKSCDSINSRLDWVDQSFSDAKSQTRHQ